MDLLAQGWSQAQVLEQYDHLVPDDIHACLEYAADLVRRETVYSVPR
jgi:uncharacterized protein (DUF433 family)